MMDWKFQDPTAEKLSNLSYHLTDGMHDEGLAHHMIHGGLHPTEAMIRLEIMRVKSETANHHRKAIRRWQRHRNISGIVWNRVEYCGYSVDIPTVDDFLDATKSDRKLLKNRVPITLDFLNEVQKYFKCWKFMNNRDRRGRYPWVEYDWDKAGKQLFYHDWIKVNFGDYINHLEQPRTSFSIFAGFAPTVCVEEADTDCTFFQLNNEKPSY